MNYTLHVLKGRSQVGAIRLIDGVNSIGRHDDCVIRIRSSQVSRRHCELFEADGSLIVRDLGSSNGTFVNGDRIEAPRVLHPGDALTVGGVTLRVDAAGVPAGAEKERDTAELEIVPDAAEAEVVEADDFDLDFETDAGSAEPTDDIDVLELMMDEGPATADEPKAEAAEPKAKTKAKGKKTKKAKKEKPNEEKEDDGGFQLAGEAGGSEGDDAVAQFLMDLKLDDDD